MSASFFDFFNIMLCVFFVLLFVSIPHFTFENGRRRKFLFVSEIFQFCANKTNTRLDVNSNPSIQFCHFNSISSNPSMGLFLNFFTIISGLYWDRFETFLRSYRTSLGLFWDFYGIILGISWNQFEILGIATGVF